MPTAVTIASEEEGVAARVQALLSTPRFRCYRTTDVQGLRPSHLPPHPALCGLGGAPMASCAGA